nr:heme-binding protein [Desulfuromonadales bacterium]
AFVMPAEYSLEDLPPPAEASVRLREVPARLMAARRYSGTWSQQRYRKNEKILLEAVAASGITTVGSPLFARYNA